METISHDILVVGGGGAGLRAAIAVSETRPDLSIGIVSKVYPMRSHTVVAEGGAAAVVKPEDSLEAHAYDTISGGDWLCDQDAVEAFVAEAPAGSIRSRPTRTSRRATAWLSPTARGFPCGPWSGTRKRRPSGRRDTTTRCSA
ncbi:MAG: FAD-binding protein, partial [Gemmatimonadota bacterium]